MTPDAAGGRGETPLLPPRERKPSRRGAPTSALLALGVIALLGAVPCAGGDEPFTFPSNTGLTGLLEIPTARTMGKHTLRAGYVRVDPYRFYHLAFSPWDWLEVDGRITEVSGVPGFTGTASYGDFKDKAVDLKIRLLRERKYLPALAAVIMDPHGTRIYSAQALVASKQVFPFDFTIGLGNGRFGERPLPATDEGFEAEIITDPKAWWRGSRLFGGLQFAPSPRFALLAEYNPVRYHEQTRDPAQPVHFREPVPSRLNFGLRWKPLSWAEVDLSWQRGNELGAGFNVAFDVGKPAVPIYETPYVEKEELRARPFDERIAAGLLASGFSDIGVSSDGHTLRVEAQNDRYFFTPTAFEAMLAVLAGTGAAAGDEIRLLIKENGIALAELTTTRQVLEAFPPRAIAAGRGPASAPIRTDAARPSVERTAGRRRLAYGLKPSLETFLNDPAAFVSYRLGLFAWVHAYPWRGGMLALGAEGYPLNTVTTAVEPFSIPVRSDIALYKEEGVALSRLLFDQAARWRRNLHGRVAAGLLEVMYGGMDAELALPVGRGRFVLGAAGSLVWKRDPDAPFGFTGDRFHTAFLTGRLNVPEWDVAADLKGGRFLAGDPGASLTLSKFINGYIFSAWYTVTDTSIFSDRFNRGYRDKGILVSIPIRNFTGRDSRTVYTYKLAPWTRDTGQDVDHYRPLADLIGRNTPLLLDRDRSSIYVQK